MLYIVFYDYDNDCNSNRAWRIFPALKKAREFATEMQREIAKHQGAKQQLIKYFSMDELCESDVRPELWTDNGFIVIQQSTDLSSCEV